MSRSSLGAGITTGKNTLGGVGGSRRYRASTESTVRRREAVESPGLGDIGSGAVLHDAAMLHDPAVLQDAAVLHDGVISDGRGCDANAGTEEDGFMRSIFGLLGQGVNQRADDLGPIRHQLLGGDGVTDAAGCRGNSRAPWAIAEVHSKVQEGTVFSDALLYCLGRKR